MERVEDSIPVNEDRTEGTATRQKGRRVDTSSQKAFDRLTWLARTHFGVASAHISLINGRHYAAAQAGFQAVELPRDNSFCARVLSNGKLLVVPDSRKASLFADDPLVMGLPQIRFFAGAPLTAPDGQRVGVLFIIDHKPRPMLSASDRQFLSALGGMVSQELQLRHELDGLVTSESTLRGAESLYRSAFEISPHGMAIVALDGQFLQVNQSLIDVLGYSEAELLARDFQSVSHREDLVADMRHLMPLLEGNEQQYLAEKRFIRKDGTAIWTSLSVSSARNDFGKAQHLVVQIKNIQHRRDAEARIAELVERNRLAVEAGKVGIWEWRVGDTYHIWDEQVFRQFGFPAKSDPKTFDEVMAVMHPDDREAAMATLNAALESSEGYEFEHRVIWPSGEVRHLQLRAQIIREDGAAVRVIGTCVDVTEIQGLTEKLREETDALRRAKEEAERASEAKSLFCANMSHELRTPLNAVIGLSYLIEKSDLNAHQRGLVKKISTASTTLLHTINSVLEISRNGNANISLEDNPFNIFELVENVISICTPIAGHKEIAISSQIGSDISPFLSGDAARLHQILLNLIGNAVKFTEEGTIRLIVEKQPAQNHEQMLKFTVSDTGIGIAQDTLNSLFQPFVQADSSVTRRYGGTGLGLSIARELVEMMGGEIGVSSLPGRGSDFWCKLPIRNCSREDLILPILPNDEQRVQRLKGTRILLVDDSDINLEVAQNILQIEGSEVETASNGQIAVDLVLADPRRFDLILLDLQMPVLNGYDAFRQIRLSLGDERPAVIALTAGAFSVAEDSVAQMEGCITKPFEVEQLIKSIRRCLSRKAVSSKAAPVAAQAPDLEALDAPWPDAPGFDIVGAQARMGNNRQLYRSLLARFFGEFSCTTLDEPGTEIDGHLRRIHRMKGSSGLLGLNEVHRLAVRLEQALKDEDASTAEKTTRDLRAEISRTETTYSTIFAEEGA